MRLIENKMKNQKSKKLVATAMLSMILLGVTPTAIASPTGTPPTGNVDAHFNTVTADNYSSFLKSIFVDGWGIYTPAHIFSRWGIYNIDNTWLNGAVYIMDALQIYGMVGSTNGSVKIADNDGFQVGPAPASAAMADFKPALSISADGKISNPMMTVATILIPAMNLPVLIDDGLKVMGLTMLESVNINGEIQVSGPIYSPGSPAVNINDNVDLLGALRAPGSNKLVLDDDVDISGFINNSKINCDEYSFGLWTSSKPCSVKIIDDNGLQIGKSAGSPHNYQAGIKLYMNGDTPVIEYQGGYGMELKGGANSGFKLLTNNISTLDNGELSLNGPGEKVTVNGDFSAPANSHGATNNPGKVGGWYNCPNDMYVIGIQTNATGNVTGVKCAEL